MDEEIIVYKKRNVISYIFGHSDENLFKRIFRPTKICNKASAHLVNILTVFAGKNSLSHKFL